jgi:hypothetical protein
MSVASLLVGTSPPATVAVDAPTQAPRRGVRPIAVCAVGRGRAADSADARGT